MIKKIITILTKVYNLLEKCNMRARVLMMSDKTNSKRDSLSNVSKEKVVKKKLILCTSRCHVEQTELTRFVKDWLRNPELLEYYKKCLFDYYKISQEFIDASKSEDKEPHGNRHQHMIQTASVMDTLRYAR